MRWIRAIWAEGLGLFLDDGWLAAAILLWLAAIWGLSRLLPAVVMPPLLFLGLAGLLLHSLGRARR